MAKRTINNVLIGEELKRAYRTYAAAYDDKKRRLKRQGITMWDTKYNQIEFQTMYNAAANEIDAKKGYGSEKAKSRAVIEYLIDRQATEISHQQAVAYQKAQFEETGTKISLTQIYKNLPQELSQMNERLLEEGIMSGAERRLIIGNAFFGSPM